MANTSVGSVGVCHTSCDRSRTIEGADQDVPGLDAGLIAGLGVRIDDRTPIDAPAQRKLFAVLFTDLVDSTPGAAARSDTVWRSTASVGIIVEL